MIRLAFVCALAALVAVAAPAHAQLSPTPVAGDSRLVQFNFDRTQTYLILTRPDVVTHVEMSEDEKIKVVSAGDTQRWELTPTKDGRHLFIKPRAHGITTSMTVITDKRVYQAMLRSTGEGQKWYQQVSFIYPAPSLIQVEGPTEDVARAPAAPKGASPSTAPLVSPVAETDRVGPLVSPDKLSFEYRITGDAPFRPLSVFDDGTHTWIKLPANLQELPALFVVTDESDMSLVNYLVRGNYMVVQRMFDRALLRLGKAGVTITRIVDRRTPRVASVGN
jgi:type IV secretion system protein VirB9